jgi:hypothetical protein
MPTWVYTVILQGHAADDKRTMRFPLATDHATLDLAVADAAAIKTDLVALTKAFVAKESLSYVISEDDQVVADESADCFEELAVSCYMNLTTVKEKLTIMAVPAPEDAVFMSDNQTLDTSNALVRAYIDEIEDRVLVSDGERLQTDGRTNGAINKGWKRSRAKNFKS